MSRIVEPALTVVVPSVNGWQDLDGCLAALERERATTALEVLVPERCGPEVRAAAAARYPWARILPVSAEVTIPEMRAQAFAEATAPTVAVIEDHVLVPPGWAGKLLGARRDGVRVVGGRIVNAAADRSVDWAAFLCEYSQVLAPREAGPAEWLIGNNTAYDRGLLAEFSDVIAAGRWENVLHEAFRRRGIVLWYRPDIIAAHKRHYTTSEYLSQRFLYARAYAGARMREAGPLRKLGYGLLALALPPVLLARIVTRTWQGGTHRAELLRAFPLLVLFVSAWGLGEAAGGWFGDGGALSKVK